MSELYEAYIGVGSNLGHRLHYLDFAVKSLQSLSSAPVRCSAVYETKPVGVLEQPDFLNMVVQIHTHLRPLSLLAHLLELEQRAGRVRLVRFGPRTLDLDILLFDNQYVCFRDLQIPHPRMWERAFVLVPLADLLPDEWAPGRRRISDLAARLNEKGEVVRVGRFW